MAKIDFLGKSIISNYHTTVEHHQLIPQPKKSVTGKISLHDNLIIHGDNLKALKALLPTYSGRVKCIYIDPPYNTGNEKWAYNDNVNSPRMQEWLGKVVDREDLTRHDKWLCMMTPRLKLLRDLLSEDGVIFISIDDNEQHHLRMIMDEIFGEENFIVNLIWKSRQITDSRNKDKVSIDHEYILCYAKTTETPLRGKYSDKSKYLNPDDDSRGPWMSNSILGLATAEGRPNLHYNIVDPRSGRVYSPPPNTGWRYSKDVIKKKIDEGRIIFPIKGDRPREKKFLGDLSDEFTGFSSILRLDVGYTLNGTRELREIFGKEVFEFPKPSSLIRVLLEQASEVDSIILDSFAGSGTTAQAVLELNKDDGGNRKFILVEMEDYSDSITAERVRRVIKGIPNAKDEKLRSGLGGTFSYFDLGEPLELAEILSGKNLPSFADLARYIFFTATGEQIVEDKIDEKSRFIGETANQVIYLLYQPDLDYLKSTALTLDFVEHLSPSSKHRLVFAPVNFVDQDNLDEAKVGFAQLPFEIYRLAQ